MAGKATPTNIANDLIFNELLDLLRQIDDDLSEAIEEADLRSGTASNRWNRYNRRALEQTYNQDLPPGRLNAVRDAFRKRAVRMLVETLDRSDSIFGGDWGPFFDEIDRLERRELIYQ